MCWSLSGAFQCGKTLLSFDSRFPRRTHTLILKLFAASGPRWRPFIPPNVAISMTRDLVSTIYSVTPAYLHTLFDLSYKLEERGARIPAVLRGENLALVGKRVA